MALHENIYRLRTARNMSQGDLAEALEVSRQSISKWENGTAVPELDRLIKMSQLFGLTLDQLVGNEPPQTPTPPSSAFESTAQSGPTSHRTPGIIAGIAFLCVAFFTGLILTLVANLFVGIYSSLPLAVCGILCLCLKKRRKLWCCWVLLFAISFSCHSSTGIGLQPFWGYFTPLFLNSSPHHILISLFINTIAAGMMIWTVWSYTNHVAKAGGKSNKYLIIGWCLSFIPEILSSVWFSLYSRSMALNFEMQYLYLTLQWSFQWVHLAVVVFMLVMTVGTIRSLRQKSSVIG